MSQHQGMQKQLRGQFLSFCWLLKCCSLCFMSCRPVCDNCWGTWAVTLSKHCWCVSDYINGASLSSMLTHRSWLCWHWKLVLTCVLVFLTVIWFNTDTSINTIWITCEMTSLKLEHRGFRWALKIYQERPLLNTEIFPKGSCGICFPGGY